jgi:hypothetical protein
MESIISRELSRRIEDRLREQHRGPLAPFRFRAEGWRELTRVIVRFTLERPDKTLHYPMEAGVTLTEDEPTAEDVQDALWLAIDFLGWYVEQYLQSHGESLLPLDWKAVHFGERELFARGWERNLALEEAADRWLAGEPVEVRECVEDRARRRRQH